MPIQRKLTATPNQNTMQYTSALQPLPRNIRNRSNKFDKNVTKRGNVPVGKAADHEDDSPASKGLIFFFLFVVVGSSLVQIFNLFGSAPAALQGDDGPADAGATP